MSLDLVVFDLSEERCIFSREKPNFTTGRKVGKQAQITPTELSMMVQYMGGAKESN